MEEQEEPSLLDIFAGIALPGVITKASLFDSNPDIARKAYDIAEAMVIESKKRKSCEQE